MTKGLLAFTIISGLFQAAVNIYLTNQVKALRADVVAAQETTSETEKRTFMLDGRVQAVEQQYTMALEALHALNGEVASVRFNLTNCHAPRRFIRRALPAPTEVSE